MKQLSKLVPNARHKVPRCSCQQKIVQNYKYSERRPPQNASIINNPVNPDFGLWTPGSGRWPRCNQLVSRSHLNSP